MSEIREDGYIKNKGGEGMKITARLENWIVLGKTIIGQIYDDKKKRWEDGIEISTSRIDHIDLDLVQEGDIIETKNSIYLLGKHVSHKDSK